MSTHADILDQGESLRRPLVGSLTLHVGIIAFLIAFNWWENRGSIRFGDPNSMGGSVGITPVSTIPLPNRSGITNPVANDTESHVPARPKQQEKPRAKKEVPDAIPLASKARSKKLSELAARNQTYRPLESDRPNQVYSTTGAAVSSPMYGGVAGIGGTGIGNNVGYDLHSTQKGLYSPYDAKVVGDYTGLTPPFGFDDEHHPATGGCLVEIRRQDKKQFGRFTRGRAQQRRRPHRGLGSCLACFLGR